MYADTQRIAKVGETPRKGEEVGLGISYGAYVSECVCIHVYMHPHALPIQITCSILITFEKL